MGERNEVVESAIEKLVKKFEASDRCGFLIKTYKGVKEIRCTEPWVEWEREELLHLEEELLNLIAALTDSHFYADEVLKEALDRVELD